MIGDEHHGAGLRYGGKRMRIVSDVEFKRAHRGLPEILARARKTLVVHIHPLELRLAGRLSTSRISPRLIGGSLAVA